MNSVQSWGEAISVSLVDLGERFVDFIPSLIGALFIFFIGLIVATIFRKIAEKLVSVIKVDQLVENAKIVEQFKKSGFDIKFSKFFGELVRWFLILVFLMAAMDVLGLNQVTEFLNNVILYIPNIVVAVIVLSIAFLFGNFVYDVVKSSTKAAGIMSASFLAAISKWAIIVFGLLTALIQLGIAESLANTLFTGLVAAMALAIGLAFGLGGKDEAAAILSNVRKRLSDDDSSTEA